MNVHDKSAKDNFQLRVYSYVYWKKYNIVPGVTLKDFNEKKEFKHKHTLEELKNTEKEIWDLYYSINRGVFPANSVKYECGRCGYRNMCPLAFPIRKKGYLVSLDQDQ